MRLPFLLVSLVAVSCVMSTAPGGVSRRIDVVVTHPSPTCDVTTATEPADSRVHRDACSTIDYPFIPPASGDHYGIWASYQTYAAPVPWGFLVHSMEHGAVVLVYDPASPIAADVQAAFAAVIAAHGVDPVCRDQSWPSRFVVAPAHDLATPLAALAWEHTYEADCIDMPSLAAFVEAHYAHAPEDLCGPGQDASATGWCR